MSPPWGDWPTTSTRSERRISIPTQRRPRLCPSSSGEGFWKLPQMGSGQGRPKCIWSPGECLVLKACLCLMYASCACGAHCISVMLMTLSSSMLVR